VRTYETTMDYAKSQGAIGLFGEKYGDIVRVVEIGDYSRELCGGTHVPHTGKVAVVRILGEGSIGSGMRRIEALVGPDALKQVNAERRLLEEVTAALGAGDPDQAPDRARRAVERIKQLESELGRIRRDDNIRIADDWIRSASQIDGVTLVVQRGYANQSADELRELAMVLRDRLGRDQGLGAAVIGTGGKERALLVASCTNQLVHRGVTAPALLADAAVIVGGKAGGKDPLAMGGGPKGESLDQALATVPVRLEALLRGS
jgi:alanyl-tRNA synthetase